MVNPKSRNTCRDPPQEPVAERMPGKKPRAAPVIPIPGLLEETAATSSGPGHSEMPGSLESAPEVTAGFGGKNTGGD